MTRAIQDSLSSVESPRTASPQAVGGVVVGIDGSPESIAALNTAAAIGVARGCPVHIVSALPPSASYDVAQAVSQNQSEVDALRINIREVLIREIFEKANPGNDWTHEVIAGRPAKVLTDIAKRRKAELIIVGRSHYGAVDRLIGAETWLQIVRLSSVPVLAVARDLRGPRTVVAAVDFSSASITAAKRALDMIRSGGALYLVYVEPPTDILPAGFALANDARYPGDVICWFRRMTAELGQKAGVMIEPVVLSGKPVQALIDFTQRVGADLLVAGAHGHTRIERLIVGSVSTGLVRNAECPVLIAPPEN